MKRVFISMLALAALASCTQNEVLEQDATANEPVEIKLTSVVPEMEAATSRTPVMGVNSLATKVLMSSATGDYTTAKLLHDGTMTFTDGTAKTGFGTPQYYPANGNNVYLCGLYPATGWTVGSTAATTADYTFDGKTDVMAAAQVASTKADGQTNGTYKALTFNHLLTKVIIKATVDSSPASSVIQGIWGKINTITLSEVGGSTTLKNKATVTLSSGAAAAANFSGAGGTSFYKASGTSTYTYTDNAFAAIEIPTLSTAIAYSMIAPFLVRSGTDLYEFKLKITTDNQTTAKELNVELAKDAGVSVDDMQGKICVITLTFKATEVKATATVSAWANGGTSSVPVV